MCFLLYLQYFQILCCLILLSTVIKFSVLDINNNVSFTVAARSKAWNVFARSNAGIVGSNPAQGMDVCVDSVFLLSFRRVDTRPRSPTDCLRLRNWRETKYFTDALCSKWESTGRVRILMQLVNNGYDAVKAMTRISSRGVIRTYHTHACFITKWESAVSFTVSCYTLGKFYEWRELYRF
jgi:hypothetical protein